MGFFWSGTVGKKPLNKKNIENAEHPPHDQKVYGVILGCFSWSCSCWNWCASRKRTWFSLYLDQHLLGWRPRLSPLVWRKFTLKDIWWNSNWRQCTNKQTITHHHTLGYHSSFKASPLSRHKKLDLFFHQRKHKLCQIVSSIGWHWNPDSQRYTFDILQKVFIVLCGKRIWLLLQLHFRGLYTGPPPEGRPYIGVQTMCQKPIQDVDHHISNNQIIDTHWPKVNVYNSL